MGSKDKSEYNREYFEANKDRLTAAAKAYYYSNREKILEKVRVFHAQNSARLQEAKRQKRLQDPEKARQKDRAYYQAHRERKLESKRKNYDPDKNRARGRKQRYGLDAESVEMLWEAQHGKCRCCEVPIVVNSRSTHVDHCHATGKICALLCAGCNCAIGHMKHNPERLRKAADYCERTRLSAPPPNVRSNHKTRSGFVASDPERLEPDTDAQDIGATAPPRQ